MGNPASTSMPVGHVSGSCAAWAVARERLCSGSRTTSPQIRFAHWMGMAPPLRAGASVQATARRAASKGCRAGPASGGPERDRLEDQVEELRDLEDVTVDASLPVEERVRSFADQIGDPYHFTTHGVEVRLSFAGQIPIEGAVARILGIDDAPLPLPEAAGASAGSAA